MIRSRRTADNDARAWIERTFTELIAYNRRLCAENADLRLAVEKLSLRLAESAERGYVSRPEPAASPTH